MKANELKCGNYIFSCDLLKTKNELYEITPRFFSMLAGGKSFDEQKNSAKEELINYFQPIKLTEEWLIKFGFEKKGFFTYGKELLRISMPSEDPLLWRNGRTYFNSWKILDAPKHVHQLQNLYFALTGEELTIKNP